MRSVLPNVALGAAAATVREPSEPIELEVSFEETAIDSRVLVT
jgi:hypothetical protein